MSVENFTCTGGVREGKGMSWPSLHNLLILEHSDPRGSGQKLSYPEQESSWRSEGRLESGEARAVPL